MSKQDKSNDKKIEFYKEEMLSHSKQLDDKATFEAWSSYELMQKSRLLKTTFEKCEQKFMARKCEGEMNDADALQFKQTRTEMQNLYINMQAKLEMRADWLKKSENMPEDRNEIENVVVAEAQQIQTIKKKEIPQLNSPNGPFNGSLNDWFNFHDEIKNKVCENLVLKMNRK